MGAVAGAELQPLLESHTVARTEGAVNAAADEFAVTLQGRGGHAAYPHLGADSVP